MIDEKQFMMTHTRTRRVIIMIVVDTKQCRRSLTSLLTALYSSYVCTIASTTAERVLFLGDSRH